MAFWMAGCSSDTDNTVPPATNIPMTFSTVETRASTNSYIDGTKLEINASIGVFAFDQGTSTWNEWSERTANLMYNQQMTYTGGESLDYSPLRYWVPSTYYSFYAYYPYSATNSGANGITISTDNIGAGTGTGAIEFSTAANAADQTDFMVSEMIADQSIASNSATAPAVDFRLSHQLSGILFSVDLSQSGLGTTTASYDTVAINGIYTKGTLAISNNGGTTSKVWTTTGTGSVEATGYTDADSIGGVFLLIPQDIPTDAKLHIVITTADNRQITLADQTLTGLGITRLEAGQRREINLRPQSSSINL